jgi:hypothetical protein
MSLNIKQLINRAKEYVELEAGTKVTKVTFSEKFSLFGRGDVVLSVETADVKDKEWWVVGGSTPMNLYAKSQFKTAEEAFSFHCGLMLRLTESQFEQSEEEPDEIGYDAFISHASEDKQEFVRPLAEKLTELGLIIWYDEFELKVGDSLRRSIDRGLANSKYGIVVLSRNFFSKNWPQHELDGLTAREIDGRKVILPIWHGISKKDVLKYSPSLADKIAIDSSKKTIAEMAAELKEEIEKDVFSF